jgi:quercetin dioxygenase-like cupin family protein
MKATTHTAFGVTATVYQLDKGEKIARHQHPFMHTTSVAAGRTEVEMWDENTPHPYLMRPGDPDFALPANIDHEIRAMEDGTIVVNIAEGGGYSAAMAGLPGLSGGVMLADGTIVNAA